MGLARYTCDLLHNIGCCNEEWQKVNTAKEELKKAVDEVKSLEWDQLFAIEDDERQELTTRQQKVIECYANLKRTLLEIYGDLFKVIKEI
jgi:hypothetical protein